MDAMKDMSEVAARLLTALRRCAPVSVRAYDAEENPREIAVPTRRKRWSQVVTTIEARPWVRVELLDKRGAAIGYVENDGPAEELEELGPGHGGSAVALNQKWLLELMIKAQTTALAARDREVTSLLNGVGSVMQIQGEAMRELVILMRMQRDAAVDVVQARAAAAAAASDGQLSIDDIMSIIKESPKVLQQLAPLFWGLRGMITGGAPQPPPPAAKNGAKP
jgi:hypothetical protein